MLNNIVKDKPFAVDSSLAVVFETLSLSIFVVCPTANAIPHNKIINLK